MARPSHASGELDHLRRMSDGALEAPQYDNDRNLPLYAAPPTARQDLRSYPSGRRAHGSSRAAPQPQSIADADANDNNQRRRVPVAVSSYPLSSDLAHAAHRLP